MFIDNQKIDTTIHIYTIVVASSLEEEPDVTSYIILHPFRVTILG